MRCSRNVAFIILSAALLIPGLGYVMVQGQDKEQKEIKNPPKDPPKDPPTSKKGSTQTRIRPKLSENSGSLSGGNRVTITGAGFNDQTKVTFGKVPAEIIKPIQSETITVVVPGRDKIGFVDVVISTPGKTFFPVRYQYKIPSPGVPAPSLGIIRIEPSIAFPNKENTFKITGRGFTPETEVQIGEQSFAADVSDSGHLTIVIPSGTYGPGPVDIFVKNRGDSSATLMNGLTFVGPKIFWIDPSRGLTKGGEKIRIHGRYLKFNNIADVLFGDSGITAGKPADDNEHTIYVDAPPHGPGWVDLVIYNAHGQKTTLSKAYYYEEERGPSAEPKKYFTLGVALNKIDIVEDGAEGKGNSWSFDIRVNGKPLCDLEARTYRQDSPLSGPFLFDICRKEIEIEEPELRIRIIGTRGEVWVDGERTVPVWAITQQNFPTGIAVGVEGNYRKKGFFIFLLEVKNLNK